MAEKLMRGWEALDLIREKGRTRSGAPMRSIKESMISRAPGERAAMGYLKKIAKKESLGVSTKRAVRQFKPTRAGVVKAAATIGSAALAAGAAYLANKDK